MKRLLLLLCLGVVQAETVIRTAPIPNRLLRQGDALLLESADGTRFVRIDLHTRHLARVEAKIIESESQNWPGSPDSAAYIDALRTLCRQARATRTGGPVSLLIDWHPRHVTLTRGETTLHLSALSPDYLRENLILILIDRFNLSREDALHLLTP